VVAKDQQYSECMKDVRGNLPHDIP